MAPQMKAKTTGQTGIMRTRERLRMQKKHLEQAKLQAAMALKAVDRRVMEQKKHEAAVKEARAKMDTLMAKMTIARQMSDARMVKKIQKNIAALQKTVEKHQANVASLQKEKKIHSKRAEKAYKESMKLQDHIRKNSQKLNQKVATRAAKAKRT